jgi:serine/threonine protein phosphatase PrpC
MTSGESLEVTADNLIRAANNNGGSDNITVVLVQAFADQMWAQPQSQATYGGAYYG